MKWRCIHSRRIAGTISTSFLAEGAIVRRCWCTYYRRSGGTSQGWARRRSDRAPGSRRKPPPHYHQCFAGGHPDGSGKVARQFGLWCAGQHLYLLDRSAKQAMAFGTSLVSSLGISRRAWATVPGKTRRTHSTCFSVANALRALRFAYSCSRLSRSRSISSSVSRVRPASRKRVRFLISPT